MENKSKVELIKEEKTNYFKKWRLLNKEKIKLYNKKYWENRVNKNYNNLLNKE